MSEAQVTINIQVSTMIEFWKTIKSAPGYEVSNLGHIRNAKTMRILSPHPTSRGNLQVTLYTKRKGVNHYVHRLVAEHWMSNFIDHLRIIHIDDDKNNCAVSNLKQEQHTKSARWVHPEDGHVV